MFSRENVLPLRQKTRTIATDRNIYFVGDMHGHVDLFWKGLDQLNFNPEIDIVISVGDLVDRGPYSLECLRLLNNPWFLSVVGNHECKLYKALLNKSHKPGMDDRWLNDTSLDEKSEMIELMKQLYWVIDLRIGNLRIGVVHADIPVNSKWDSFVNQIKKEDLKALAYATFSRKIVEEKSFVVPDLDYLIIGHQGLDQVKQWGNVLCIDTSVFVPSKFGKGHGLTFAFIDCGSFQTITIRQ